MFDVEGFVEACTKARKESDNHKAITEVVARAVAEPAAVLKTLGEPTGGIHVLHRSPELTVLNVVWPAKMTIMPHNHQMWAVIGIYTGREDNIFWRRLPADGGKRIEAAGAKSLSVRDAAPLGHNIIHSVTNPIPRLTGALHVYGGAFFDTPRSEWDPETLSEEPFNVERARRLFAPS